MQYFTLIAVFASIVVLALAAPSTCPAFDKPECLTRDGYLTKESCSTPYVVDWCPYMCEKCDESQRPTCNDDSNCHESDHGCVWIGARGSAEFCSSKTDSDVCKNKGGGWGCQSCDKLSLEKYCPFMCGYC